MPCDACAEAQRRKHPRPTRIPYEYVFNDRVVVDVFTIKDCEGKPFFVLKIICAGTKFQVCIVLGEARGVPISKAVRWGFLRLDLLGRNAKYMCGRSR